MDKNKNVTEDTTALQDMPETGGDVKANEPTQDEGVKGGQATQQKQEEESFKEFEQKGQQSEEKSNQPSESEDLWGQE